MCLRTHLFILAKRLRPQPVDIRDLGIQARLQVQCTSNVLPLVALDFSAKDVIAIVVDIVVMGGGGGEGGEVLLSECRYVIRASGAGAAQFRLTTIDANKIIVIVVVVGVAISGRASADFTIFQIPPALVNVSVIASARSPAIVEGGGSSKGIVAVVIAAAVAAAVVVVYSCPSVKAAGVGWLGCSSRG